MDTHLVGLAAWLGLGGVSHSGEYAGGEVEAGVWDVGRLEMDEREQLKLLVEWHRDTQRRLKTLQLMVGIMFFFVVAVPVLKQFGLLTSW